MKIQIMSDLHLEFAPLKLKPVDADLIILAGDIQPGGRAVQWAKETFEIPVLYVPGNHEYYGNMLTMDELSRVIRNNCIGTNIHFLDCNHFEMDGVRFLGTTLWTDLLDKPFGGVSYGVIDSDAAYIRINDGEGLNDHIAQSLFDENCRWLNAEIEKPFTGKTVVITHHAPSGKSIHPQYAGNPWNSAFVTDMGYLMGGDRVDLWIHGHTHCCFDYLLNGTRVVCNPRGYPDPFGGFENPEFNPALVVEV